MSKKQLLNESEIRRFMKLANLQPLAGNVLKETSHLDNTTTEAEDPMAMTPDASMDAAPADMDMGSSDEMEVEVDDEADPDKKAAFEAAVQALADAMGIDVELESQEEQDAEGGEEMHDLGDEEEGEAAEAGEEEEEEEEEEVDETVVPQQLSEDELVETVLSRVTARLVAEAKKKSKVRTKMEAKKKKKKDDKKKKDEKDVMEEAADAKGGGPLLSQGKNKHDVYKGHADMAYAKGKEGKGGHQLEDLPAKAEHSVTHGGKNLATLGGNNKKV